MIPEGIKRDPTPKTLGDIIGLEQFNEIRKAARRVGVDEDQVSKAEFGGLLVMELSRAAATALIAHIYSLREAA